MMRKALPLVTTALFLAACGTNETPVAATVTVTQDAPVATAAPDEGSSETASPSPAAATASPPEADETEEDSEDLLTMESEVSDRGNLIKLIGQKAGAADEDTGEVTVEFTVDSITVDYDCKGALPPQNGHYVGVEMSIETFPAMATSDSTEDIFVDTSSFAILGPDGTRENDSIGNAYECVPFADQVPSGMGAAEKASGVVVLDTKYPEGILILQGSAFGVGTGGWEWTYPQ